MATHERELTETTDLCTPDGKFLNDAAVGWSRVPLIRANLSGWGRTKKWNYWGFLFGDGCASVTFASLDYVGLVALEWADFSQNRSGRVVHLAPLGRGISFPDVPGASPLVLRTKRFNAQVVEVDGGTQITADWRAKGGGRNTFDVVVDLPSEHESVNVVVPWSSTRFQYTSKHQARRVHGSLTTSSYARQIGGDRMDWATNDIGRGRWPYRAKWNWAGGSGATTTGQTVGIQMGSKWTDGTGVTENGIIIDGVVNKIGEELQWDYDPNEPMNPWRVHSQDGSLDLTLSPDYDKPSAINIGVLCNVGHQVFGTWAGTVPDENGGTLTLSDGVVGFAEEIAWRW